MLFLNICYRKFPKVCMICTGPENAGYSRDRIMQSLCHQFHKLTHLFCSLFAYIALILIKHDTYQLYHYSLNIQGKKKPNKTPTNLKKNSHKPGKYLQVKLLRWTWLQKHGSLILEQEQKFRRKKVFTRSHNSWNCQLIWLLFLLLSRGL